MDYQQIIEDCKAGNPQAMEYLYRRFSRKMLQIIESYVQDHTIAYDILHDGFLIVFSHISDLQDQNKIESWIGRIMRNLAVRYASSKKGNLSLEDVIEVENYQEQEALLSYDELMEIVDRLPKGYGKIFKLSEIENKSHIEIGHLLGIAPHSSSSQLSRAKELLRFRISEILKKKGFWVIIITLIGLHSTLQLLNRKLNQTKHSHISTVRKEDPNTDDADTSIYSDEITESSAAQIRIGISRRGSSDTPMPEKDRLLSVNDASTVKDTSEMHPNGSTIEAEKPSETYYVVTDSQVESESVDSNEDMIIYEPLHAIKNNHGKNWMSKNHLNSFSIVAGSKWSDSSISKYINNPDFSCSNEPLSTSTYYRIPLSFSILAQYKLSEVSSLESGLTYTYRQTDVTKNYGFGDILNKYRCHFVGIPLGYQYVVSELGRFKISTQLGIRMDLPVASTLSIIEIPHEDAHTDVYEYKLPVQWSLSGGIGIEYQINSTVGLYLQPALQYHLNVDDKLKILYKKPCEFMMPIGIRFSW